MSAVLPADILTFVKTIEYNVEKGDGGADTDDTLTLCALVRSRQEPLEAALQNSITKDARLFKLEIAARFAYDAILASSVCDEPCECIDCQMLESLGEALDIPRIGET